MDEGLTKAELADVYRRYGYVLHRRCRVLVRDEALADDALQETFVKLLRAGAGLRGADQPLRWLYRVVDRACFDLLRRTKLRRVASLDDDDAPDLLAPPGVDHEARSAALRVLARLDAQEQGLAVMAYVDGMTQSEIARELGISQPAVHKRLAALRERAVKALGAHA